MKIISILFAGILSVGQALAQDPASTVPAPAPAFNQPAQQPSQPALNQETARYAWADVLRVDPVYDEVATQQAPHEECYEEQVIEPVTEDNGKRAGATVLGAIIGGIIGNRFGKGDGRKAATAAGAVAGGVVGNNLAERDGNAPKYTTRRHCPQVAGSQRHIVAYDVEYRYRGDVYSARLNYDPGDRIRVRVSVSPAE